MQRLIAAAVVTLGLAFSAASATIAEPMDDLVDALRIDDLMKIVRDEGLANAADILPRAPSGEISDSVMQAAIDTFDAETMQAEMRAALAAHLDTDKMAEVTAFFRSEAGKTLVNMELSARRAIMDSDIEEVARSNWENRREDKDAHIEAIRRYAQVNDLVERNTAGAMIARYEFLQGLAYGSGKAIDEDAALADIWEREREILVDTESWLMGYLLLAYGPVPTDAVKAYTTFSLRPAGEALNLALFDGFEVTYRRISYELGRLAGQAATARDL